MVLLFGEPACPDSLTPNANSMNWPSIQRMDFLQLKLIFESFSRSSCFVATSASALQDGANESPEGLTANAKDRKEQ